MDNKNMFALTLGIGAVGSAIAYYGFTQMSDEETDTNKSLPSNENNNVTENTTISVKDAVVDELEKQKKNVAEKWSGFWKKEYENSKEKEELTDDVEDRTI